MKAVNQINPRFTVIYAENELRTLQLSDVHYDSKECDRELLDKHLKEAEKIGALVFINGDWFDLMQGKKDPRGSYTSLRPEYKAANYLDLVIQESADYLSQFNLQFIIGRGNHETNITERMHHDPIASLAMLMRNKGRNVIDVGYDGYICYRLNMNTMISSVLQYFHHGYGGAAPRSKGVLNADLNQAAYPDADIYTTGHTHNKTYLPLIAERVSKSTGAIKTSLCHHIQTGSYKQLSDMGWAKEKGFKATPMGGWWMDLKMRQKRIDGRHTAQIEITVTPAQ